MDERYIDIAKSILGEIGLAVDHDNNVYDQDTFNPIEVAGKGLIFSYKPMHQIFCAENQIVFEPFINRRMMMQLFAFYLKKEEIQNGIYYMTWNVNELPDNKVSVSVTDSNNNTVTSKSYYNPCLAFCDFILQCGYPFEYTSGLYDLTMYESLWETK